ncbi:MAG: hypothetical protein LBH43_13165 [Treponema sp.]|jgi:hypothetical protein|nr:hypothetical protein [Treponema sp.]
MELPAEREGVQISYTALCGILIGAGITSKRKRREAFGEMLQADASSYGWFGDGKH